MKLIRLFGSLIFVLGLFTAIFVGMPWYIYHDPTLPWWLKAAVYCLMGGILLVLLTVAIEQRKVKPQERHPTPLGPFGCCSRILRKSLVVRSPKL